MGRYTSGWQGLMLTAGRGKYYDSKQQETVMDRRERHSAHRAAFPLYKSPPVLTYWKIGQNGPGQRHRGNNRARPANFFARSSFLLSSAPAGVLAGIAMERDNGVTSWKGNFCSMSFLLKMGFRLGIAFHRGGRDYGKWSSDFSVFYSEVATLVFLVEYNLVARLQVKRLGESFVLYCRTLRGDEVYFSKFQQFPCSSQGVGDSFKFIERLTQWINC